jgi:glycosyltransferase involved in cell wall biosynthesis
VRLLITNHGLDRPAGTETYLLTIVPELMRRGHQVSCFAAELGEAAKRLRALGAVVTQDPTSVAEPDVVHASHVDVTHEAMAAWPLTPFVFVSHGSGIREVLEQPPVARSQVQRWIAVSEWVRDVLSTRDQIAAEAITVIRNPVDLDRYRPLQPVRSTPRTALLFSNHNDPRFDRTLEDACRIAGLELRRTGGVARRWDVVSELNHADVVITIGRGAIEAMACGRPVVLLQIFGGDGPLTPENAEEALASNYSGLVRRRIPDAHELACWLAEARPDLGSWGRGWVEQHHDVGAIVDLLVHEYEAAVAQHASIAAATTTEQLLRDRIASLYPSIRWARRAGDRFDWQRAAVSFPVWAPDVGPELDALLSGMKLEIEQCRERVAEAEASAARSTDERDALRAHVDAVDAELEALKATRTFRARRHVLRVLRRQP